MRRLPVVARAGPDLHLYETVVFLCERNPAGQVGVTCYSGNRMSDDQDHSLGLTQWVKVEAAPDGGILAGVVGEARVFVWRKGNRLKAYNADCPHLGGPLNEGVVAGLTIRCPWHHACFDLTTGEATAAPAPLPAAAMQDVSLAMAPLNRYLAASVRSLPLKSEHLCALSVE
jgi:nitrite reductase/ring-hydroxylating ferredoxin subunit